jgi:hypothetical protein
VSNLETHHSTKRWHWTDDLARILTAAGHPSSAALLGWIATPVAVRGEGEALAIAQALLGDDDEDPLLAA